MKKKTIAIFTTTRAEFGALVPFLDEISKSNLLEYQLFVGGGHLREECGYTVEEIKSKGYTITDYFDYLDGNSSQVSLSNSMGRECSQLTKIFDKHMFDIICLTGDRYELIPIALSSILFRKPILHLYGGEVTEGVIDEQVRHMLTKASHLHFTSTQSHAKNVIRMGEEAWRVFVTGELVIDVMAKIEKIPKNQLFKEFELDENIPTVLLTYHPVASSSLLSGIDQISSIFRALSNFDFQVMVTAPNVEVGSSEILAVIKEFVNKNENYRFCASLGSHRYYSFLSAVAFVIGNSSSGIVEAPFFKIPTVNIGSRQLGRIYHNSIIDVDFSLESILSGIKKAINPYFQKEIASLDFLLGDGNAAKKMRTILEDIEFNEKLLTKKLDYK